MEQVTFENMCEKIDETARKASLAACALTDAVENSVYAVRRAAKQGSDAAAEFLYDAKKRVRSNPLQSVALTFAVGIIAGSTISMILRRR